MKGGDERVVPKAEFGKEKKRNMKINYTEGKGFRAKRRRTGKYPRLGKKLQRVISRKDIAARVPTRNPKRPEEGGRRVF